MNENDVIPIQSRSDSDPSLSDIDTKIKWLGSGPPLKRLCNEMTKYFKNHFRKRVKGLTAPKFSKEKGILVTEVREIAIRLEHPNLSNYEKLCLTFTNTYDSNQELIRLGLDSHFCPYEKSDSFLEIYSQDVKCK